MNTQVQALDFTSFIFAQGEELKTNSKQVAEAFGKRHDNVLRDIEKTLTQVSDIFGKLNFEETEYVQENNLGIPTSYRMYEMTKDGFMFLVMGFTGKVAAQIKEAYINAFNAMQAALCPKRNGLKEFPQRSTKIDISQYNNVLDYFLSAYESNKCDLTPAQYFHIVNRVREVCQTQVNQYDYKLNLEIARIFNSSFGVPYIKANQYERVCKFLKCEPIDKQTLAKQDFIFFIGCRETEALYDLLVNTPIKESFNYQQFIKAVDEMNSNDEIPIAIVRKGDLKAIQKLAEQLL